MDKSQIDFCCNDVDTKSVHIPHFPYTDSNDRECMCDVVLALNNAGRCVIVATERSFNTGMSITNAAEQVAEEASKMACTVFETDFEVGDFVFIERYDKKSYPDDSDCVSHDLVTFAQAHPYRNPSWRPVSEEEFEEKLGKSGLKFYNEIL